MEREELLTTLTSQIVDIRRDHPVRVAIDGVDGAGKTTLADELRTPLRRHGREVIRSSVDGFHNPAATRYRRGNLSPEGYFHDSFDYPGLVQALLQPLGSGGAGRYRRAIFDFRTDSPVDAPIEEAASDAILLFDGVFLLRPELREHWDLSIFVHADFDVTMKRAEARDLDLFGTVANVRRRYEEKYIPGQKCYLAESRPERWANIVINNNDPSDPIVITLTGTRNTRVE